MGRTLANLYSRRDFEQVGRTSSLSLLTEHFSAYGLLIACEQTSGSFAVGIGKGWL